MGTGNMYAPKFMSGLAQVMLSALSHDSLLVNYAAMLKRIKGNGRVGGVVCKYACLVFIHLDLTQSTLPHLTVHIVS